MGASPQLVLILYGLSYYSALPISAVSKLDGNHVRACQTAYTMLDISHHILIQLGTSNCLTLAQTVLRFTLSGESKSQLYNMQLKLTVNTTICHLTYSLLVEMTQETLKERTNPTLNRCAVRHI